MLYSGQLFDKSTGLQFLRARYYDAASGRFTQKDTVAGDTHAPATLHQYAYAGANPVIYTDPSGHGFQDLMLDVQGAALNVFYFGFAVSVVAASATAYGYVVGSPEAVSYGQLGMAAGLFTMAAATGVYAAASAAASAAAWLNNFQQYLRVRPWNATAPVAPPTGPLAPRPGPVTVPPGPPSPSPTVPRAVSGPQTALGRGSTADMGKGTWLPSNLREKLAVEQAAANPAAGQRLRVTMTDSRWPASQGWVKMEQKVLPAGPPRPGVGEEFASERITVHYNYNMRTGEVDDFKIVTQGPR